MFLPNVRKRELKNREGRTCIIIIYYYYHYVNTLFFLNGAEKVACLNQWLPFVEIRCAAGFITLVVLFVNAQGEKLMSASHEMNYTDTEKIVHHSHIFMLP